MSSMLGRSSDAVDPSTDRLGSSSARPRTRSRSMSTTTAEPPPAPTPSTRPTAASGSSPATPWSPRCAARSTSSPAPATSTPRTRPPVHLELTIEAASIDTRNADRDGHLRSNDFFDMETFPQITFASTAVEHVDDATLPGHRRPDDQGRHQARHRRLRLRGHRRRPVRQPPAGPRRQRRDQPQGLGRHLERPARGRRRAGQREGHPRVRGVGDQGVMLGGRLCRRCLTPPDRHAWAAVRLTPPAAGIQHDRPRPGATGHLAEARCALLLPRAGRARPMQHDAGPVAVVEHVAVAEPRDSHRR